MESLWEKHVLGVSFQCGQLGFVFAVKRRESVFFLFGGRDLGNVQIFWWPDPRKIPGNGIETVWS